MIAAITILIAVCGAVLLLILFIRIRDTGKELRLDQHRSKEMGFADLLVYAAVVEDGVIVGKNGSLMAAWVFCGDDSVGLCLLCHSGPVPEERFQGTMAPSLAGAGARWTVGQLRLRLVDPAHLNADTIMPAYYRTEGLNRVGRNFAGKTILNAGQVEDVVAYLATLKERP